MLLSFNRCSISAWTAPIYFSVECMLYSEENTNIYPQLLSQLQCVCVSPITYRFVCKQYHVIASSERCAVDFCLFQLRLSIPVNSYGNVGALPPFNGTYTQRLGVMTPKM